ncbi:MAG: outer membrane beta-barrel protein [bacterium]|nr:outer membrane beta-barrel protein [bacterium]
MKKVILVLAISLMVVSTGFSQIKIGLFGGYNILFNDVEGTDVTKGGIALGIKGSYSLEKLAVGAIIGYLPCFSYEAETGTSGNTLKTEGSTSDVPIIVFAQYNIGEGPYILGGLGLHIISTSAETTGTGLYSAYSSDISESSAKLGLTLGGGYEIAMDKIGIELGALLNIVFSKDDEAGMANLSMLTIHAGVNYKL